MSKKKIVLAGVGVVIVGIVAVILRKKKKHTDLDVCRENRYCELEDDYLTFLHHGDREY